jgi:DNA-binding NarL/FixJ family response regulator
MKILIVDDNKQVRTLLRDYLPSSVSEVYECADGEDSLASYREHRPDWVLMDQDMPGVDGITAIRQIIAEFPKAKICMVTVFDDDDLRSEAFTAGASGFVLKDRLTELEAVLAIGSFGVAN